MTFNQQKIYAVIYDRFIQKRYYTDAHELSDETRLKYRTFMNNFRNMNGIFFNVKWTSKGLRIDNVQRISDRKTYW